MKHTGIQIDGYDVRPDKDGKPRFVKIHKFDASKQRRIIKSKKVRVQKRTPAG